MSILILAHQKTTVARIFHGFTSAREYFLHINRKGLVTLTCLTCAGIFLAGYLVTLYWTFSADFKIRAANTEVSRLKYITRALEIEAREKEDIVFQNNAVVQSLEKISEIKYLTSDSVAELDQASTP